MFAHSVPGQSEESWELLSQHRSQVAKATRRNSEGFGAEKIGEAIGWLHDVGKAKPAFQDKLRGAPQKVSHSGEGARYAHDHFRFLGKLTALCIAGHHSGLPNGTNEAKGRPTTPLLRRLTQSETILLPAGMEILSPIDNYNL